LKCAAICAASASARSLYIAGIRVTVAAIQHLGDLAVWPLLRKPSRLQSDLGRKRADAVSGHAVYNFFHKIANMDEAKYRFWDTVIKAFTALGLIITGVWTVWQYFENARFEAYKPFATKQLEIYADVARAAAQVAEPGTKEEAIKAKRDLDTIVNGPLPLVEEQNVSDAVNRFYNCHDKAICDGNTESHFARALARECQKSLARSWQLHPLTTARWVIASTVIVLITVILIWCFRVSMLRKGIMPR
jgi:hypothetical protein